MVITEIVGKFLAKMINNNDEYLSKHTEKWRGIGTGHLYSQFCIVKMC